MILVQVQLLPRGALALAERSSSEGDVEVGLQARTAGGALGITWRARCLVGRKASFKTSLEELRDNAVAFKLTTHNSKFDLDVRMDLAAALSIDLVWAAKETVLTAILFSTIQLAP